ncbi:similar to Saccharomyces cerevisiae YGL180W ATG1 Protein ser/thr kinase required for vesicle formation in autophagy and the cytoplasm-to-vacuole targeting (Cvt) pathway [Maudiozyma barnettii]|uniref:Serine/threonine-protein kinase ATG1 n=1 Tax=Maudiozyma barnettii TaxID=61262 RepID=A0A8H2VBW0_9SACH|nr:serine/threonine protein kinase ATG1 [Kazachstania barnettii]CAB4252427.1 similar to Saccharomyces cerevisiae YGL180W ATG1 Protein ser/thr kinase required for vesicle formation in autophagy and the cytoplasm-to-vacuole targeting (Cvt) pathway [Kazachstania barnettii]CAD1779162.1 similar to Saccharomyces cerevisiae YGL180W ATG1 Protein ser/thr kinase required for vesicle formation in autophagy and the cytoplasm-to-vacuole targeting (Cvt) pathway [Kazachstania barnettii]
MSGLQSSNKTVPSVIANGTYTVEKEIGKGSFAIVYRGHLTRNPSDHIAVKAVSRSKLKNKKLLENLEIEIAILKKIKHNHIVSLIDCERTQNDFYLIMEYCALGDLTFLIKKRKELIQNHPLLQEIFERYPPPSETHNGLHQAFILNYLQQLASALKFLRSKNLVHRDIKPQNLLLSTPMINYTDSQTFHTLGYVGVYNLPILKIADFGFARFLPNSSLAETLCGSPLYMAPEILNYQKYNAKADLWSVGTVVYEMCCGNPPFKASNHLELFKRIKRANNHITFPTYFDKFNGGNDSIIEDMNSISLEEKNFHDINDDLRDLICSLLTFDPKDRLGFDEFFNNKLVNMDLSRYEIDSTNNIETKSKNIQESNMFISEFLSPKSSLPNRISSNTAFNKDNDMVGDPSTQLSTPKRKNLPLQKISSNITNRGINNSDLILEKEYVVVEKKSVEVNELADEFAKNTNIDAEEHQQQSTINLKDQSVNNKNGNSKLLLANQTSSPVGTERNSNRTLSNNSRGSRRASLIERRLSLNSLNPTNALSRALGIASLKLFGETSPTQAQQQQLIQQHRGGTSSFASPSIFSTQMFNDLTEKIILRINKDENSQLTNNGGLVMDKSTIQKLNITEIVHTLEILSAKAFVIYSYAEVKYAQIIPIMSRHHDSQTTLPGKRLSTGSCAIDDEDEEANISDLQKEQPCKIDDIDLVLYKEAITLYLKTLEILSKSMKITSLWWFKQVELHPTSQGPPSSLRLNLLVQWIREKFNECLTKAEYIRTKLVENDLNDHTEGIFLEKLLYDRALDISKNAAKMELNGQNLTSCELSYATSLWMLEVIRDDTNDIVDDDETKDITESSLGEDDKEVINKYIQSISGRLKALRLRLNIPNVIPVDKHLI